MEEVKENQKEEKVQIYDDVVTYSSQSLKNLMHDLQSLSRQGPTTLGTAVAMIYQGIREYIDATIYTTNDITISNLKEALAEPTPEDTVNYLKDWLQQYENHYEIIPRHPQEKTDEKAE